MAERRAWDWRPWLLAAGLVVSLAVVGFFAVRGWQHVPRPGVDEPIRAWMSVPYIARAYRVPPAPLYAALGLPDQPLDRRPLLAIARAQHRPVSSVIVDVQDAIIRVRVAEGTPAPAFPSPTPRPTAARTATLARPTAAGPTATVAAPTATRALPTAARTP